MPKGMIYKAGGILIKDRKLMVEKHGGLDTYILPGGKLEPGETVQQAVIRELYEEFRITVDEDDVAFVGSFEAPAVHSPDNNVKIDAYIVHTWSGEITLHDGIEDIAWIDTRDTHRLKLSAIVLQHVLPLLKEKQLID